MTQGRLDHVPLFHLPLNCTWILDPPRDGAMNMAIDEALADRADQQGLPALRIYFWRQPTLSLGYFQAAAERQSHQASLDCSLVRRASGGGAIVHDSELTYSLAMPISERLGAEANSLYRAVHQALCRTLDRFGVAAELWPGMVSQAIKPPFLCFQRRAVGDVVIGASKIAGSAQRRHRRALLQHGSILLAQSPHAPELPGIAELTGGTVEGLALAEEFRATLAGALGLELLPLADEAELIQAAEGLVKTKFGSQDWTGRR